MPCLVDTSWTFAPGVLIALVGYAVVYGLRWRTRRREGGARAAGALARRARGRGGIACLFVALSRRSTGSASRSRRFHMVQHLLIADLAPILPHARR